MITDTIRARATDILRRYYGYSAFRPMQLEIVADVIAGRDTVVLMPTGGGKSLCFQIPALMTDGVVIVVSPLISLMADQVTALQAMGIPAAALNSNQTEIYNRHVEELLYNGRVKLLYVSPERLLTDLDRLSSSIKVSLIAIDEAHCISQWGHDFRPSYTRLAALKQHYPDTPVMALTATADRITREDIARQLCLNDPTLYISSFDRPNLSLKVVSSPSSKEKERIICDLCRRYSRDSGIVYCLSRKGAEGMAARLHSKGFSVAIYHAGLTPAQRDEAQRQFTNGEVQVVCATVAFGMGIDKSNIRWVVHNNMPRNIESYYQEIGRAGRDGLPAETILFYSLGDLITLREFAKESGQRELNLEKLQRMRDFAEARICRRRMLLSYFNERMEHDCGNCDVCLDPPERIDGTVMARMAMSAAVRTGQRVGVGMLVDILRGSARAELVELGYNQIKTFGVGRHLSGSEWTYYIGQMVQLGIFEVAYDDHNRLRVTPYGEEILYKATPVELSKYTPLEAARSRRAPADEVPLSPDERLLDTLKDVRIEVAKKEGVAPYMTLNDRTLSEIVAHKPTTIEAFAGIEGVGDVKLVKYWKPFVNAVCLHLGLPKTAAKGASLQETRVLIDRGFPVDRIAKIKSIAISTVYSHIAKLVDEGIFTDYFRFITPAQYQRCLSLRASNPDDYGELLRNELPAGLPYLAWAISRRLSATK